MFLVPTLKKNTKKERERRERGKEKKKKGESGRATKSIGCALAAASPPVSRNHRGGRSDVGAAVETREKRKGEKADRVPVALKVRYSVRGGVPPIRRPLVPPLNTHDVTAGRSASAQSTQIESARAAGHLEEKRLLSPCDIQSVNTRFCGCSGPTQHPRLFHPLQKKYLTCIENNRNEKRERSVFHARDPFAFLFSFLGVIRLVGSATGPPYKYALRVV